MKATYLTDKTLGMPLGIQRRDEVLHNGPVTAPASRSEHVKVVVAAIGLAVLLVETVVAERLPALSAEEVFRMPRLV